MWIELGNVNARFARGSEAEREWLRGYLTFNDEKARFRGETNNQPLFNPISDTFPAGLVPLVKRAAGPEGQTVEVFDRRTRPASVDPTADLAWLRPYQREAVNAVVAHARGIVWAATGAGKTEIAIGLVKAIPVPWLLLVHRGGLADQAASRYELRTGLPAGRVFEGEWRIPPTARLVCATFQSVAEGIKRGLPMAQAVLARAQGLMIDECHTAAADTFWGVAQRTKAAFWRVGFSGTPLDRTDRRSVLAVAALGPVIFRLDAARLVKEGVLARPTITLIRFPHPPTPLDVWADVYRQEIARNAGRNRLLVDATARAPKPALVFVKDVDHGKAIMKALEGRSLRAAFVWGQLPEAKRKAAIDALAKGDLDVIVSSVVLQEGTDIPEVRSVIVASAGKSTIAALQRVGRGMRRTDDKHAFTVVDVLDRGCGCEDSHDPRDRHAGCVWLSNHAKKRRTAYLREKFEVVEATVDEGGALLLAPRRGRPRKDGSTPGGLFDAADPPPAKRPQEGGTGGGTGQPPHPPPSTRLRAPPGAGRRGCGSALRPAPSVWVGAGEVGPLENARTCASARPRS